MIDPPFEMDEEDCNLDEYFDQTVDHSPPASRQNFPTATEIETETETETEIERETHDTETECSPTILTLQHDLKNSSTTENARKAFDSFFTNMKRDRNFQELLNGITAAMMVSMEMNRHFEILLLDRISSWSLELAGKDSWVKPTVVQVLLEPSVERIKTLLPSQWKEALFAPAMFRFAKVMHQFPLIFPKGKLEILECCTAYMYNVLGKDLKGSAPNEAIVPREAFELCTQLLELHEFILLSEEEKKMENSAINYALMNLIWKSIPSLFSAFLSDFCNISGFCPWNAGISTAVESLRVFLTSFGQCFESNEKVKSPPSDILKVIRFFLRALYRMMVPYGSQLNDEQKGAILEVLADICVFTKQDDSLDFSKFSGLSSLLSKVETDGIDFLPRLLRAESTTEAFSLSILDILSSKMTGEDQIKSEGYFVVLGAILRLDCSAERIWGKTTKSSEVVISALNSYMQYFISSENGVSGGIRKGRFKDVCGSIIQCLRMFEPGRFHEIQFLLLKWSVHPNTVQHKVCKSVWKDFIRISDGDVQRNVLNLLLSLLLKSPSKDELKHVRSNLASILGELFPHILSNIQKLYTDEVQVLLKEVLNNGPQLELSPQVLGRKELLKYVSLADIKDHSVFRHFSSEFLKMITEMAPVSIKILIEEDLSANQPPYSSGGVLVECIFTFLLAAAKQPKKSFSSGEDRNICRENLAKLSFDTIASLESMSMTGNISRFGVVLSLCLQILLSCVPTWKSNMESIKKLLRCLPIIVERYPEVAVESCYLIHGLLEASIPSTLEETMKVSFGEFYSRIFHVLLSPEKSSWISASTALESYLEVLQWSSLLPSHSFKNALPSHKHELFLRKLKGVEMRTVSDPGQVDIWNREAKRMKEAEEESIRALQKPQSKPLSGHVSSRIINLCAELQSILSGLSSHDSNELASHLQVKKAIKDTQRTIERVFPGSTVQHHD